MPATTTSWVQKADHDDISGAQHAPPSTCDCRHKTWAACTCTTWCAPEQVHYAARQPRVAWGRVLDLPRPCAQASEAAFTCTPFSVGNAGRML